MFIIIKCLLYKNCSKQKLNKFASIRNLISNNYPHNVSNTQLNKNNNLYNYSILNNINNQNMLFIDIPSDTIKLITFTNNICFFIKQINLYKPIIIIIKAVNLNKIIITDKKIVFKNDINYNNNNNYNNFTYPKCNTNSKVCLEYINPNEIIYKSNLCFVSTYIYGCSKTNNINDSILKNYLDLNNTYISIDDTSVIVEDYNINDYLYKISNMNNSYLLLNSTLYTNSNCKPIQNNNYSKCITLKENCLLDTSKLNCKYITCKSNLNNTTTRNENEELNMCVPYNINDTYLISKLKNIFQTKYNLDSQVVLCNIQVSNNLYNNNDDDNKSIKLKDKYEYIFGIKTIYAKVIVIVLCLVLLLLFSLSLYYRLKMKVKGHAPFNVNKIYPQCLFPRANR